MPVGPGARIGPYEVLSQLGRGGMGVVYRARDARLRRDVAIKVLPDDVARDPERLARFQREAQVLASLNHQNIAQIYGLEDADSGCIVMELVEGQTLADVIRQGPVPLDDALQMARQLADALDAAHERGIVHRDLKPANVKITPDGKIKVLDFGLAKALGPRVDSDATRMSTADVTHAGVVMGTAPYMSPEQARGKDVDARTDIWAFGCVLYELLTAQRAFDGDTTSDVLAKILTGQPDWERLPADTPGSVRTLLTLTLTKDAKQRLQHVGDARPFLTGELLAEPPRSSGVERPHATRRSWVIPAAITVGLAATIAVALLYWRSERPPAPPTPASTQAAAAAPPPAVTSVPAATTGAAPTSSELEREAWDRVKGSGNRAALEAFLTAYPRSDYASLARVELALLTPNAASAPTPRADPTPPSAASGPSAGQERTNPRDGQRYVWIPPGIFRMGCSPGDNLCANDERPVRPVGISKGFWLGQMPVPIAAWQRYRTATGAAPLQGSDVFGRRVNGAAGDPSTPAVIIKWEQARAFCEWTGGRLPSEAEWEYAARAGTTGPRYGQLDDIAWYADNSGRQRMDSSSLLSKTRDEVEKTLLENGNGPRPVGQKQPNAWNLYDMLGNVAQWTSDEYTRPNRPGNARGGRGAIDGDALVTRGGSWFSPARQIRASARFPLSKTDVRSGVGFRCLLE